MDRPSNAGGLLPFGYQSRSMIRSCLKHAAWLPLLFNLAATAAAPQGMRAIPSLPNDSRLQDGPEFVRCAPAKLSLTLTPPDAQVDLLDFDEEYVAGMSLNVCSVRVTVRSDGYLAKTVDIDLREDTEASITLVKASPAPTPGTLTLQLSPPDAKVVLPDIRDRYKPGMTVSLDRLRVQVSLEGYRPIERWISVTGDTMASIELKPLPPTTLTLDLFPNDATVELAGIGDPYTPGMILPAGPVNVRVTRRGYEDTERLIDIEGDTHVRIEMEMRTTGTLTLDLFPADTEVRFLDEASEEEYRRGMALPLGRVRMAFRRYGYRDLTRVIDIVGDVRELVELEALPTATLTLDISPADAVADLPDSGQTYWPGMPLTLGEHRLVVRQEGYQDFDELVEIDKDRTLRVRLTPTRKCSPVLVRASKPRYPTDALSREIEGHVEVEFQIVKAGTVSDAKVIAATPPEIFDQAAIDAILKFRYSLPGEDCESVDSVTNKVRVRFDLVDR